MGRNGLRVNSTSDDSTGLAGARDPELQGEAAGLLDTLPAHILMRARLLSGHLLLPENAQVVDVGSADGQLTAALAMMNPRLQFTGVDLNMRKVEAAEKAFAKYNLPNLRFQAASAFSLPFAENSADAIINSRVLGEIYTRNNYNERRVSEALAEQFRTLKDDGILLIYDYAMQPTDDLVQIEFPVSQRDPRQTHNLSMSPVEDGEGERLIALLQWFAENARARQNRDCRGFYLEEMKPRVPYTRLFRLPHKWAYEYIIRCRSPQGFKAKIMHEYTCFTEQDFTRVLNSFLGARVLYTMPWRAPRTMVMDETAAYRMFDSSAKPIPRPVNGYVFVAQKITAGKSLSVSELRPSQRKVETLNVHAVKDGENGKIIDLVSRANPTIDVLPWFKDEEGRLKVVLQGGAHAKPLVNVYPRDNRDLDGRTWSGHVVSALTLPSVEIDETDIGKAPIAAKMLSQNFGLHPRSGEGFARGPYGYPAPDFLDERSRTLFVQITQPKATSPALKIYDVEDVLRAINVGFVPNAWLEVQIKKLMEENGLEATPWLHQDLPVGHVPPPPDRMWHAAVVLRQQAPEAAPQPQAIDETDEDEDGNADTGTASAPVPAAPLTAAPLTADSKKGRASRWPITKARFRDIRGTAGTVTAVRSVFVDQGQVDGVRRGLASQEMEFALPQGDALNVAAILPLAADFEGNVLAGFEFKEMPVPDRMGEKGAMINMPVVPLPASVRTIDDAKLHIAFMFGTFPDKVVQMGESFFTHMDMTPQRIYPFAIAAGTKAGGLKWLYAPLEHLHSIIENDASTSLLWTWGSSYAKMCFQNKQTGLSMERRKELNAGRHEIRAPKHVTGASAMAPAAPAKPAPATPAAAPVAAQPAKNPTWFSSGTTKNDNRGETPTTPVPYHGRKRNPA